MHDMLNHPWLVQFEAQTRLNNQCSFIDNRIEMGASFKERILERGYDAQQAGDFARLLISKMAWVSQSQQTVI